MMIHYDVFDFSHATITHQVYHRGEGPAVVLLHELTGPDEKCRILADRLAAEGFHVFMPVMFGEVDGNVTTLESGMNLFRLCINREFNMFMTNGDSPILDWLRQVCSEASARSGGGQVGVLGMCLTGNFALSLVAEPVVEGAVACQPSFPVFRRRSPGVVDVERVRERANALMEKHRGPSLLAYRFQDDRNCLASRFQKLSLDFPHSFRGVSLPGGDHSILTHDFAGSTAEIRTPGDWQGRVPTQPGLFFARDLWSGAGEPTHNVLIEIIAFLRARLM